VATIERTVWTQKRQEKNPKLGKKARRKTGAKVRKRREEKEENTEEVEKKRSQDTGITRPPSQLLRPHGGVENRTSAVRR